MRRILDIIRIDLITINGGKNNLKTILLLMLIFFGVFGFLFSPIFGVYASLIVGGFFVPMIFHGEQNNRSGKLWGLLPIRRRDLVNARFALSITVYTALFLAFYLLMLLAQKLKLSYKILDAGAGELDIIALLVRASGGAFTELGLFNLLYFGAFAFGLMIMAGSLRKHFKDSKTAEMSLKKATKREYFYLLLVAAVGVLAAMVISGVIKIGPLLMVFGQLLVQLAAAANGFILAAVLVTIAVFSTIYKYICTVLEYDEKEL